MMHENNNNKKNLVSLKPSEQSWKGIIKKEKTSPKKPPPWNSHAVV